MTPAPKVKENKNNRPGMGNKNRIRPAATIISISRPSPASISKPAHPILKFPSPISLARPAGVELKKWCFVNNVPMLQSGSPEAVATLMQGDIVTVRRQNVRVGGSQEVWAEVDFKGKSGWVQQAFLDDYVEEFPGHEVKIDHQTADPDDAQQYLDWEGETQYNMCGELCVAYIVGQPLVSVLEKWKNFPEKGSFSYSKSTIKVGTTANHLQDIFRAYDYTDAEFLEFTSAIQDQSLDKDGMRMAGRLKTHYLVALVRSNLKGNGELLDNRLVDSRKHWVVVNAVTHGGNRVEIYNPFHNRREIYSYSEFYNSCVGGAKLSGFWVKRKKPVPVRAVQGIVGSRTPAVKVQLGKLKPRGAEQYVTVEGATKHNLCGEFCVSYILTRSIDCALDHWKQQEPSLAELVTILKTYGYYNNDPLAGRGFTIKAVLNSWKEVQKELYNYHVGQDKGTGTVELRSMLEIYGYNTPGDLIDFKEGLKDKATGQYLLSPGRIKKMLETHFLIVGVGISNRTGELRKGMGPGIARHWEVLEEIHPTGRHYQSFHRGGNGGFVKLYNPFTNKHEEYSYRELTESMGEHALSWVGVWVKRDVRPLFTGPKLRMPDIEVPKGKPVRNPKPQARWPEPKLLGEIQKKIKQQPADRLDANRVIKQLRDSGWPAHEILQRVNRLLPRPQQEAGDGSAFENKLLEKLNSAGIPPEVVKLVRQQSGGKVAQAADMVEALRECGVLMMGPKNTYMLRKFPDAPDLRETALRNFKESLFNPQVKTNDGELALKIARQVRPALAARAMDEIKKIQTTM